MSSGGQQRGEHMADHRLTFVDPLRVLNSAGHPEVQPCREDPPGTGRFVVFHRFDSAGPHVEPAGANGTHTLRSRRQLRPSRGRASAHDGHEHATELSQAADGPLRREMGCNPVLGRRQ